MDDRLFNHHEAEGGGAIWKRDRVGAVVSQSHLTLGCDLSFWVCFQKWLWRPRNVQLKAKGLKAYAV